MAEQTMVDTDTIRQTWREQGVEAAEALFQAQAAEGDVPALGWMLGCELALARADLPAVLQRWQRVWAVSAEQPALRLAQVEWLWTTPWDQELAPLWQLVAEEVPGKPAWRKAQVQRGLALQRPYGARALMARMGKNDSHVNWWQPLLALWSGEGDEAWMAGWMRLMDSRWLPADQDHSNQVPDPGTFRRLDHWVSGGHAAVIQAWRALVPPGAWADWLAVAEAVAHWRAIPGQQPVSLDWPASVHEAWPKAVQRQALARLALLARQPEAVRAPWLPKMEAPLARHWPPQAAQRVVAQLELGRLLDTDADDAQVMAWLESKAQVEELRDWWAPRALRVCLRQPDGLSHWWDWCERFGTPELPLGKAGQDALTALCLSGRDDQADSLLDDWRNAAEDSGSAADRGWLALGRITLAAHQQQPERAWLALNDWWQTLGLAPVAAVPTFSPQGLLASATAAAWPAAAPAAQAMPVTAVLLWPSAYVLNPDAVAAAERTLRGLLLQDAPDLRILVAIDRPLPDGLAGIAGPAVQVLTVSPELDRAGRTQQAIAAVDTPWLIWATPGAVWHPQAVRARQQHLARYPQAEASAALLLALTDSGQVSVQTRRSGLPDQQDGYLLRTARARALAPLTPDQSEAWAPMRERIERQLGTLRRPVWPGPMGMTMVSSSDSSARGHGLAQPGLMAELDGD